MMKNGLVLQICGILFLSLGGFLSVLRAAPGDLDPAFAGNGFVRVRGEANSRDAIVASAVQPDGKFVSIGDVYYSSDFRRCAITRHNPDGSLDASFDGDGKLIIPGELEFYCTDVAVQNDGKIVVAGNIRFGDVYDFMLRRYNADGTPDTSFGNGGKVLTDFFNSEVAPAIEFQPDGKLVLCGISGNDIAVGRYNPDGTLDSSFGAAGRVTTDVQGADQVRAVVVQPDGKIVVGGNSQTGAGATNDFVLVRYNPDGTLDASFDGDGKVTTDILGSHDNINDLALQPDGKIVAGGQSTTGNHTTAFALARYNPDGTLDSSFGAAGKVTSDLTYYHDYIKELAIQPDGKIVAAGAGYDGRNKFAIARYGSTGALDNSFDADGSLVFGFGGGESTGAAMILQADGKIVISGSSANVFYADALDFSLARLNPDGSFDASFDGDGKATTNLRSQSIAAEAVAIQPDGKIVAVGTYFYTGVSLGDPTDFVVYRYNADGTPDNSFDGDGKAFVDFGIAHEVGRDIAVQPDGKILVAGNQNSALVLARLNADGTPDASFGSSGKIRESGQLDAYFSTVTVQPDGKILAAGRNFFLGYNCEIYRYNADGTPDNSFDGDGRVRTDLAGDDEIRAIAVQPDGKIVTGGRARNGASYDFMVGRYNANGTLDSSFDGDGVAFLDFVGGDDYVNGLALQADGKIVVAGASSVDNSGQAATYDSALARFNPDGTPDNSFDGDGRVRSALSPLFDAATGVVVHSNGKIVTSGTAAVFVDNDVTTLDNDLAVVRYNANGLLDGTFAANGKALIDLFSGDAANDIALDSGGKYVVAGATDGDLMVARVLGGAAFPVVRSPFDFDGDGKTDISIFRPSLGQWWYSRSSDGQTTAAQFGNSSDRIVPADFSGDGKTDIAIFRPATGEWFVLRSEDGSFYAVPFGQSGDVPVPADYDADGRADVAVFRPSTGIWYVSRSTGGTDIVNFGQPGDVPATGDYDGDGRADLAIYRPAQGQWWLNRSTAGVTAVAFGASTDKPVPGDYTGDGKTDVAFYRPDSGEWFILRSENGSFYAVPFGQPGDVPAAGDYDGDGRFDTAVFRPAGATWYVNRSTAGLLIAAFGASGDRAVPSAFLP